MFKSPIFARVSSDTLQVALRGRGKSVLSHVRGGSYA
jgi:hypothetical protein